MSQLAYIGIVLLMFLLGSSLIVLEAEGKRSVLAQLE